MEDFVAGAVERGAGAELDHAAGICGDDGARLGLRDGIHFLREELERGFRLRDVVDPRGAAAEIGERHLDELDAGDGANQLARSFADFLAMREMTRILVRDAQRDFAERRSEAEFGEEFGDVANFRTELRGVPSF